MFDSTIIWIRRSHSLALAMLTAATLVFAGCGKDSTGPDSGSVTGQWSGTALFGNAYSSRMELTQSGRTVDGFMWLAGELVERPLQGEIDDLGRFAWVVAKDCKIYSGLLNHQAGGQELNGTIIIDESNCAVNNSTSGTLQLTRH